MKHGVVPSSGHGCILGPFCTLHGVLHAKGTIVVCALSSYLFFVPLMYNNKVRRIIDVLFVEQENLLYSFHVWSLLCHVCFYALYDWT